MSLPTPARLSLAIVFSFLMSEVLADPATTEAESFSEDNSLVDVIRYKRIQDGIETVVEERTEKIRLPIDHATKTSSLTLPAKGTSMVDVERDFGAPGEKTQPVGQPPITRWIYSKYIVVYEHNRVIHVLAR